MPVLGFWWNAPNTVHGNTRLIMALYFEHKVISSKPISDNPQTIPLTLGRPMDNPGIRPDLPQRLLDLQTRSALRVYFRPLPGEFSALFGILFAMVRVSW
jgi:hypothetical protein